MELMRRIAPGRLSEIFGKVALKNDTFFAGLGIEEASEKRLQIWTKTAKVIN
jgi:penicillin amidase